MEAAARHRRAPRAAVPAAEGTEGIGSIAEQLALASSLKARSPRWGAGFFFGKDSSDEC